MIELLNIDCMDFMNTCVDKSIEIAIVDPPYGIKEHGGKNRTGIQSKNKGILPKKYKNKGWDNQIPTQEYFIELERVSCVFVMFGANYFPPIRLGLNPFKPIRKKDYDSFIKENPCGWIIWDKKTNDGSDFNDCEMAWTNLVVESKIFKYDWVGFGYLNNPQKEKKIHPTQKPVQLYRWILYNYTFPFKGFVYDLCVLDTHMGSGSSAIAAHQMGFDYVGCEIDKDYYDAACKRFRQQTAQQKLL